MAKRVVVGMSGGVDSSLAAALLKDEGYEVIGLFMRNWREKDGAGVCLAEEDYRDVRRVCDNIGIPYYSVDFSKEYYERVFSRFVEEYAKGRTPNPDVLCNREIKFDVFKKYATELNADYVATGHYCNVSHISGQSYLMKAKDSNKDQTYFLCAVTSSQLENVIFPLGNIDKPTVRELARKYALPTAEKKDSTGICFIGERNFREFLSRYIPMKKGLITDMHGRVLGEHNGVFYYTVGQRKGLGIGGVKGEEGSAWFVAEKDVVSNRLIVSRNETLLYHNTLETENFNYIPEQPEDNRFDCTVRIRHRQEEQKAVCLKTECGVQLIFDTPQRAIAAGQYAVVYRGDYCIGGGVIDKKYNS